MLRQTTPSRSLLGAGASLNPGVRSAPPIDVLRRICDAALTVGDAKIRSAQLPDKIVVSSGAIFERPPYWR